MVDLLGRGIAARKFADVMEVQELRAELAVDHVDLCLLLADLAHGRFGLEGRSALEWF